MKINERKKRKCETMSAQDLMGWNQRISYFRLLFSLLFIYFFLKSRSVVLKTVLLLSVFLHFSAGSASAPVKHPQEAQRLQRRSPGVRDTTGPTKSDSSGIFHFISMDSACYCRRLLPDLQIGIDNVVVYLSLLSWEWRQDNCKAWVVDFTDGGM